MFCDRGLIDSKAFVSKEEFKIIADKFKLSEETLATHYNAVFHMTSVAKYNRDLYVETDVRQGDASESIKMDDDILGVYKDHPYRIIIGNFPNMQEKVCKLFYEIESFLSFWFKV